MTFHDDKLWQEAFTALLDLLEQTDNGDSELAEKVSKEGMKVLTEIAQAVANRDRKFREIKLRTVGAGNIVALRSLLSVMWAREMLDDDEFAKLDGAYEALADKLPR
jgi:hypothetical protein